MKIENREQLRVGGTVLESNGGGKRKILEVGNIYYLSYDDNFHMIGGHWTFEQLQKHFTIHSPKSELKKGDRVEVCDYPFDQVMIVYRRYFSHFEKGRIKCFTNGDEWMSEDQTSYWNYWRLPEEGE